MDQYDLFTGITAPAISAPDPISDAILEERRKQWLRHPCTVTLVEYLQKEILDTETHIDRLALHPTATVQIQLLTVKLKTLKETLNYANRI